MTRWIHLDTDWVSSPLQILVCLIQHQHYYYISTSRGHLSLCRDRSARNSGETVIIFAVATPLTMKTDGHQFIQWKSNGTTTSCKTLLLPSDAMGTRQQWMLQYLSIPLITKRWRKASNVIIFVLKLHCQLIGWTQNMNQSPWIRPYPLVMKSRRPLKGGLPKKPIIIINTQFVITASQFTESFCVWIPQLGVNAPLESYHDHHSTHRLSRL